MELHQNQLLTIPQQNAKRLLLNMNLKAANFASKLLQGGGKSTKQRDEASTYKKLNYEKTQLQNTETTTTTSSMERVGREEEMPSPQSETKPIDDEFPEMAKNRRGAQLSGKGKKKQGMPVEVANSKPAKRKLWGLKLGKKKMRLMKLLSATANCARKLRDAYVEMMMGMASSKGASSLRGIGLVNHNLAAGALLYPDSCSKNLISSCPPSLIIDLVVNYDTVVANFGHFPHKQYTDQILQRLLAPLSQLPKLHSC